MATYYVRPKDQACPDCDEENQFREHHLNCPQNQPSEKCCETVWTRIGRWGKHTPCSNKGKVQRDGKWYCGRHDPVSRKAKLDAKTAASDRIYKAQADRWAREEACVNALAGIPDPAGFVQAAERLRKAVRDQISPLSSAVVDAAVAYDAAKGKP